MMSSLIILALSMGIATCVTTLSMYGVISNNILASKEERLFAVQIDSLPLGKTDPDTVNGMPTRLTYADAMAVRNSSIATNISISYQTTITVSVTNPKPRSGFFWARVATADFFEMFDVPFQFGQPWEPESGNQYTPVVVITKRVNQRLFDGTNSIGQKMEVDGAGYTVIGVVDDWLPIPRIHDLAWGGTHETAEVFLPFSSGAYLQKKPAGPSSLWGWNLTRTYNEYMESENAWLQVWVEIENQRVAEFEGFLASLIATEKKKGRIPNPPRYKINRPSEWIQQNRVVSMEIKAFVWLSVAFFSICMTNTVILLLAKMLSSATEYSILRALGASKGDVFIQHFFESGIVVGVGALLGLLLAKFGLYKISTLVDTYKNVAVFDWHAVFIAICFALISCVVAGGIPAWRITRIPPANYLRLR